MDFGIFGVGDQDGDQQLRIEDVDAHGGVDFVRMQARALGLGRLFLEAQDAPVRVGFDDAEAPGGLGGVDLDGGDGDVGAGIHVLLQHLPVIHFVDVVAGQDEDVVRVLAADRIDILIDGVGGAQIPIRGNAHLRRQHFDEFAEPHQRRPALADVAVEAQRFVLREDEHAPQVAVDAIGKRDVDDAVDAAEGHGGLGAVARERPEPLALAPARRIPMASRINGTWKSASKAQVAERQTATSG